MGTSIGKVLLGDYMDLKAKDIYDHSRAFDESKIFKWT